MTKLISILILNFLFISLNVCHKERNILSKEFELKRNSLNDLSKWKTQLKTDIINNLEKLPETAKKSIIEVADEELKHQWVPITAMEYLDFKLTGHRFYEAKVGERDDRIRKLMMAEIITKKGKYLSEVINGLWLTLEESTWVWPAHMGAQKAGVGLPDPNEEYIDLGAGERSRLISWLSFIMGDELSKLSPILNKRIEYELSRRIFNPYLKNSFGWMGMGGQNVNNWNIWINTNIMISALLDSNHTKSMEVIARTVKSADDWINSYGDDGGCDEGPGYWAMSGANLIKFLYWLSFASNHQMKWSSEAIVNNIGSYIYKVHIDRDYFVNFADAGPKMIPDPIAIYTFGQTLDNKLMKEFGAYLLHMRGDEASVLAGLAKGANFMSFHPFLDIYNTLKTVAPKAPQPQQSWFPDLQVLTLRSQTGSAKGLFLGAKAGTNGESHNHNDVGSFILYVDGLPALIDVGGGTYTAKYFSKDRYTIWHLQSQWHNCPTINGILQHDGLTFKANNVSYKVNTNDEEFTADIAGAYPPEAHVKSWVRKLTFHRTTNSINLDENYSLDKFVEPSKLHFVTVLEVGHTQGKGEILFHDKTIKLNMKFDINLFDVQIDKPHNEDTKIIKEWINPISRVTLVTKHKDLNGKHDIQFHL